MITENTLAILLVAAVTVCIVLFVVVMHFKGKLTTIDNAMKEPCQRAYIVSPEQAYEKNYVRILHLSYDVWIDNKGLSTLCKSFEFIPGDGDSIIYAHNCAEELCDMINFNYMPNNEVKSSAKDRKGALL